MINKHMVVKEKPIQYLKNKVEDKFFDVASEVMHSDYGKRAIEGCHTAALGSCYIAALGGCIASSCLVNIGYTTSAVATGLLSGLAIVSSEMLQRRSYVGNEL